MGLHMLKSQIQSGTTQNAIGGTLGRSSSQHPTWECQICCSKFVQYNTFLKSGSGFSKQNRDPSPCGELFHIM